MIDSKLSCKLYKYTGGGFLVQAVLIINRNIENYRLESWLSASGMAYSAVFANGVEPDNGVKPGFGFSGDPGRNQTTDTRIFNPGFVLFDI